MKTKYSLSGGVGERDGVWGAGIRLETPDGKKTAINSGFIFHCKEAAERAVNLKSVKTFSSQQRSMA